MSLKRAGLTGRLNNQPRVTARRFSLSRISLRRFPFPSAPPIAASIYVEDVFATYLYTGTGSTQNISNNIRIGDGATTSGWVSTLASGRPDIATYGYSVAVDSVGNVYVAGISNNNDFQLTKYNSSGVVQWQKSLGGSTSSGNSVAVDGNDNVYVAGSTVIGTDEAFLVKYNSSGTLQWQRTLGGLLSQSLNGVKVDSSGNVYVCGDIGSGGGGYDCLIAKYDTSGVLQWQRILGLGGASYNFAKSIAIDNNGNSYISGLETVSGNYRIMTAKYDSSGVLQWQRRLTGGSTDDRGNGAAVDGSGNVYICGFSNDGASGFNIIIAKYNTSGVIQWQRRLGTTPSVSEFAYDIAADSSGNVYVVGISDSYDFQIAKYDTSGTLQWQRALTFGSISIYGESVTVDNNGVYVCGYAYLDNRYVALTAKLPTDGSGIGGYSVAGFTCNYKQTVHTNSAITFTNAASTLSNSAGALTNAASTLTEATGNLSSSLSTINTGTGFGGLVWMKSRSAATDHALYDTTRGATKDLSSSTTDAETTQSTGLTAFTNNGFTIGGLGKLNTSTAAYASWTFRKQAKFFDIVTYTGNGGIQNIPHNLGSTPGFIIIKTTSVSGYQWIIYHRSMGASEFMLFNGVNASTTSTIIFNNTSPTSTQFTVGNEAWVNQNGATYVAYLFAHNAEGFGSAGTDNVISCGSFSHSTSATSSINLGFEPQFLIVKKSSGTDSWYIFDVIRGAAGQSVNVSYLSSNLSSGEQLGSALTITPNGFEFPGAALSNGSHIYIAIRRGPMRTPTNGAEVFQPVVYTGTNVDNRLVNVGMLTDMIMARQRSSSTSTGFVVGDRLRGNEYLRTGAGGAGVTDADSLMTPTIGYGNAFSAMNGFGVGNDATSQLNISTVVNNQVVEAFRRAPGFLDIVLYTGTGSVRTVNHSLGVVPQMIWVKETSPGDTWVVYTQMTGSNSYSQLDSNVDLFTTSKWNNTEPTSSVFSLGSTADVNSSADLYVAYLMGNVPGVSNLSYYVGRGEGTSQQVNCGFTGGARFVMLRNFNTSRPWYVYDSARGIITGNDPWLTLNDTAAENTSTDYIDPYSEGFEVSTTAPAELNAGYGEVMHTQAAVDGTLTMIDIVYGGGLWVVVSSGGNVSRSVTGYGGWSKVSSVVGNGNGVTFGNGLYVVVGNIGAISTSSDAITWTSRTSGVSNALNSATYAFGKYWVVGNSGTVLSSTDGITWSSVSSGTTNGLNRIRFLNNNLVIVGDSGTIITSSDGVTFTVRTSGVSTSLRGAAYGAGLYVVVGASGTVRTSPDLVTWTARTGPTGTLTNIVWASYRFVVQNSVPAIQYSADGITWTSGTSAGSFGYQGMWFANDIIMIGNSDGDIFISDPRVWYWAIA